MFARALVSLTVVLATLTAAACASVQTISGSAGFAVADLGPGGIVGLPGAAQQWLTTHPDDPRTPDLAPRIADRPAATWVVGDQVYDKRNLAELAGLGAKRNGTVQLVLYHLPGRNDGITSPDTSVSAKQYRDWVDTMSATLGRTRAIVIIEPDALWFLDRQYADDASGRRERLDLIRYAAQKFSDSDFARVYVDAGTSSGSVTPDRMGELLASVGVGTRVGFAVNVSSFAPEKDIRAYAHSVRGSVQSRVSGSDPRYVVDTSRNGNPTWDGTWCNPPGRKIGHTPAVIDGTDGHDYDLWVKGPGDSDGPCGSAPHSVGGEFLPDVAFGMM